MILQRHLLRRFPGMARSTAWHGTKNAHRQCLNSATTALFACNGCTAARTRQLLTVRQLSHHGRLLLLPHRRQREAGRHAVQANAFPLALSLSSSFLQAGRRGRRRRCRRVLVGRRSLGTESGHILQSWRRLVLLLSQRTCLCCPYAATLSTPGAACDAHTNACTQVNAPAGRCVASL